MIIYILIYAHLYVGIRTYALKHTRRKRLLIELLVVVIARVVRLCLYFYTPSLTGPGRRRACVSVSVLYV